MDAQAVARPAIESFVDYDDWFIREVEKGLAQINRGEVLAHETVGARLEKHLISAPATATEIDDHPPCRDEAPQANPVPPRERKIHLRMPANGPHPP